MKVRCGNCGYEWENEWANCRPILCKECGAVWLYADLPFVLPKEYICEIAEDPKSQVVFAKHKIAWDGQRFLEMEYKGNEKVAKRDSEGKITVFNWDSETNQWSMEKANITP